MDYCKLNCKANKKAFKQIVDEINNGGGGGGITKITIADADHLFSNTLNVKVDDQIVTVIKGVIGTTQVEITFTGFTIDHTDNYTDFIGYGTRFVVDYSQKIGIDKMRIDRSDNSLLFYASVTNTYHRMEKAGISEIHYTRLLKF